MARGKAHDDETRAAVLAALLAGQSINAVARQYQLSNATVLAWRRASGLDQASTPVQPQNRARLDDLLLGYVSKTLTALSAQQDLFADRKWLEKQPASELAVLHGVSADKALRLFEAFQRADDAREGDEGAPDVAR